MAGNTAEDDAIEARRAKAWDLRVRGKTYREIGDALGVSGKTAHQDCHAVLDRLKADTDDKAEHHRALQLARIERLTAVLMPLAEAADIGELKRRITDGEDIKAVMAAADAAFDAMDRLDKLEKRRAALLGLDAPVKQEIETYGAIDASPGAAARLVRERFGQHAAKVEGPGADPVGDPSEAPPAPGDVPGDTPAK